MFSKSKGSASKRLCKKSAKAAPCPVHSCDDSGVKGNKSKHARCCSIEALPNEILEYIFTYLNVIERIRSELVCRRWREIGKTLPWSWPAKLDVRELKVKHLRKIAVTDDILSSILSRCGKSLRQLILSIEVSGYRLTSRVLGVIGKSCPNLLDIKLGLAGLPTQDLFTNWHLISLAKGCSKLKYVTIKYSYDLDDANLSLFLKQCHSLEYLDLTENRAIRGECFGSINANLRCFCMFECKHLNPSVVAGKLVSRCEYIEELVLIGCCKLKAPMLSQMLNYYKNTLKVAHLDEQAMTSSEWGKTLVVLGHLEELSLCGTVGVDDNTMKLVAEKCKKLETLNISETDITDYGVSCLALAPSLKVLDISFTHFIDGDGVANLALEGRLEELHFSDIYRSVSVLENSCVALADCCSNFRLLDVCENKNITNRLVDAFRLSLERSFLNGPVSLYVAGTEVKKNVDVCENLKLFFQTDTVDDFYDLDE